MKTPTLQFIGYASGIAARVQSSCMGPLILQDFEPLKQLKYPWHWIDNLYPSENESGLKALEPVAELCTRLAQHSYQLTKNNQLFATIGGDHSCAIGTWSGVAAAVPGPIGLLWIDAHMDSHTPETSISKNIHGMPLAALLGHGPSELTHILNNTPKLRPEHVCLLGVRSFEAAEQTLLNNLGVRVYCMPEINERGLETVMKEALQKVNQGTLGYGISVGLNGIDPLDAPASDKHEANGIRSAALLSSLDALQHYPGLLALEIAEFSPKHDIDNKTADLIVGILDAVLSKLALP